MDEWSFNEEEQSFAYSWIELWRTDRQFTKRKCSIKKSIEFDFANPDTTATAVGENQFKASMHAVPKSMQKNFNNCILQRELQTRILVAFFTNVAFEIQIFIFLFI